MKLITYNIFSHRTGTKLYCLPYTDLVKKEMTDMHLVHADLKGKDLRDSNFSGSNLTNADLSGCNLSGCDFNGCYVIGCKFDGANLNGAVGLNSTGLDSKGIPSFYKASWKECDFTNVNMDWLDARLLNSSMNLNN